MEPKDRGALGYHLLDWQPYNKRENADGAVKPFLSRFEMILIGGLTIAAVGAGLINAGAAIWGLLR